MPVYKRQLTPENALARCAALCSRSEQAEYDIRTKLRGWGIGDADSDKIVSRLVEGKYLDEERYARAFVRDKFRFGGWGRLKIAYALRQKHVAADVIDEAMNEIEPEDYESTLEKLMQSKYRTVRSREKMKAKAALMRFAIQRGFEPDMVARMTGRLIADCDDSCEEM